VLYEYGLIISEFAILSPVETSQVVLGSLIPMDVPTQVAWHMRGCLRNGGSEEDVEYAKDITLTICGTLGWTLYNDIPTIPAA
jgi:hypothetical protein